MATKLGVSEMTIRRDLRALELDGTLLRTHGGAVASDEGPLGAEPPFLERQRKNAEAKRLIARAALEFVREHETIGIDVGTTTLQLAKNLAQSKIAIRVFTTSLRAAMTLAGVIEVYCPGGVIRPLEMSMTGNMAVTTLENFQFDRVFLGVSGITESGLFDYSIADTELKAAFLRQSREVIVLVDSSKFGVTSTAKVADLRQISVIITDKMPQPAMQEALEGAGVRLIVSG